MPCFLVGEALSEILASLYNVKNYRFSHQAGHVMAAEYSSKAEFEGDFLAFHISGGTTEILYVKQVNNGYNIKLIGGSCDLHAGQAIDRIGVRMGLSFPCGTKIEELAKENTQNIPNFRISVNGLECNLSGLENIACKLLESNDNSLVAAFTINFISRTIEKLTENLRIEYPDLPIVFAGGVMSNIIIQNNIKAMFKKVYFAKPEFSSDNACGISLLTRKKHFNEEGYND